MFRYSFNEISQNISCNVHDIFIKKKKKKKKKQLPQIFREQRASASFDRLADNSLAKFHSLPFAKGEKREAALPGKTDSLKDRQTDRQRRERRERI